ncbi:MAG TPA: TetR/AcrR family transcriptional regulator C-terminal domain-containing protein [Candidatus Limnocylindria bacterium]|nr:TetR/AcrR family transcriptional regulator C-terminal domain-containing protein [Candidatus Limnocylindria bacterium]
MSAQSERSDLPWWSKSRSVRKRTLNVDRIVAGGMALLDRDGLEGLSLRRLGAELGSGATSVYWHVPNKDALLDLLVDRLMEEAADQTRHDPGATWRAELAAHSVALRAVLQRHTGGAALLASRVPVGPNGLRFMEGVLSALTGAGFGGHQRALAYAALTSYTIGQVVLQAQAAPTNPRGRPAAGEQLQRLGDLLRDAPRGRYPNVVESAADLTEITDEQAFSYGLQRMLDGLEAELAPVNPRRRVF